ncbi:hypothetical protein B0J14DRAFT_581275 [Halenospora varia]|nr:hypothetical protein B0J14DRAFT_581275 [Halenospora varia]
MVTNLCDSLYNPNLLSNLTAPLWIYLPPIGSHLRHSHPPIPRFLRSSSTALATINYRWNHNSPPPTLPGTSPSPAPLTTHPSYSNHPFPTPLHDVLHAFSYLTTSYLPSFNPKDQQSPPDEPRKRSKFSPKSAYFTPPLTIKPIQRPLLIYGSYLSGPLATSLALTESFESKNIPYPIAGVIVKNASPNPSNIHWNAQHLHALKTTLFTSPASAFDSFISPILFFRTPGLNIPKDWPENFPPLSSESEHELDIEELHLHSTSLDPSDFEPAIPHSNSNTSSPPEKSNINSSASSVSEVSSTSYSSDSRLSYHGNSDSQTSTTSSPYSSDSQATTSFYPPPQSPKGKKITQVNLDPPQRKSHLKYPPHNSGLRIPRTLFITTAPPATLSTPISDKPGKRNKGKGKKPKKVKKDGISPLEQANEMAGLMRRSIKLHEFRERKQWDESLDPEGAAAARVQVKLLGDDQIVDGEKDEGELGPGNGYDLEERKKRVGKREWWEGEDDEVPGSSGPDGDGENDSEEAKVVREWLEEESLG